MDAADLVLELLRESGNSVSGEEIAARLGISRNSVWKAVNKLRRQEYGIKAVTNRGYLLVSESSVLSPENLRRYLDKELGGLAIDIREEVTSTNTVLKQMAEQGGREGMVLIAQKQTQGKGRLGRSFYSPRLSGLYMSVLLRPKFPPEDSLAITTAAAAAVAGAVDQVTGRRSQIKWVNDVYLAGRKICGILTEASLDFENGRLNYAVLGIGINVQAPPEGFPQEIRQTAGALYSDTPPAGTRVRLAAEVLNRFFRYYSALPERTFMEEYQARSLLTGREITFQQGRQTWEGVVLGIDPEARLVVRLPDGQKKAFGAGEVSIVKGNLLDQLQTETKEKPEERGEHL